LVVLSVGFLFLEKMVLFKRKNSSLRDY